MTEDKGSDIRTPAGRTLRVNRKSPTEIGRRFVSLRKRLKISQKQLAALIGLTGKRVSHIENGLKFGPNPTRPSRAVVRLFEAVERGTS